MTNIRRWYIKIKTHLTHSYTLQLGLYLLLFFGIVLSYIFIFWYYYPLYEGKNISFIKAVLFVAETITTVGYGEFTPFRTDEMSLVAIIIMVSGIIAFFGVLNLLITPIIQSRIRPIPPRRLPFTPRNHFVIFGYSQMIQEVLNNLKILGASVIIIESDKEKALVLAAEMAPDVQIIWGDYHEEQTWKEARIENAGFVILFLEERISARITLGIRELTKAEIIAIITDQSLEKYLKISGADQVISTKDILGAITALHTLLNVDPEILQKSDIMNDVISKTSCVLGCCQIARIPVIRGSSAIGKTIGELHLQQRYQFKVIEIIEKGIPVLLPGNDYIIKESNVLFLIGNVENLFTMVIETFISPHIIQLTAIIAGYGDMGLIINRDMNRLGIQTKTIDIDESRNPSVIGSAEQEEILIKAGVNDSHFLLVVTNDDDINFFTTLMAKELNPNITTFCRANNPESVKWMYKAGANYVINVPSVIAQALGRLILFDASQVLINREGNYLLIVRYYSINKVSKLNISDLEFNTGIKVVALDHDSRIIFPGGNDQMMISPGDAVYVLGKVKQIERFINTI
jgi:voltage-gated potassium channel